MPVRSKLQLNEKALVFVTTTVRDWFPIFQNQEIATAMVRQLDETSLHFKIAIAGYVLIPSHLHTMIGLQSYSILLRFMQSLKGLSSRKIKLLLTAEDATRFQLKDRFRLWMPRYDDFVVTSEKQFRTKLEYIHNNPVKAGLVENSIDWAYSSASNWLGRPSGNITIEKSLEWIP